MSQTSCIQHFTNSQQTISQYYETENRHVHDLCVENKLPVATGEILLSVPLCVVSETPAASGLFICFFFLTEQNLSVSENQSIYICFFGLLLA